MVLQANASAAVVRKMDGYRGDYSLRDAAVRMFDMYALLFDKDYKRMTELEEKAAGGKVTAAAETEYEAIGQKFKDAEKNYEDPFLEVQKKFARKYKVKMTDNEYQKDINKGD